MLIRPVLLVCICFVLWPMACSALCADISADGVVDLQDFGLMADEWLATGAPAGTTLVVGSDVTARRCGSTVICDGVDDQVEIQQALDGLTPGRDFIETVTLKGSFTLSAPIVLSSYTRLDLAEARLTLAPQTNDSAITNADLENGNTYIEICGGRIDGNKTNQYWQSTSCGISFRRVRLSRIVGMDIGHCLTDGIRLSGHGQHTRGFTLTNLFLHDNGQSGLNVMWAMRQINVSDIIANQNNLYGIRSDHSEGLYTNITANENQQVGIFIRNVFGNNYTNLTATRNGRVGIHVLGMVESVGTNWVSHNNGSSEANVYSDILYDETDTLSYGRTKRSTFVGLNAGSYEQYGPTTEKYGIEFQDASGQAVFLDVLIVAGSVATGMSGDYALPANRSGLVILDQKRDSDSLRLLSGRWHVAQADATHTLSSSTLDNFTVTRTAADTDTQSQGEYIIGVVDTGLPRTVTLRTADLKAGRMVIVKDESGHAGSNPITVIGQAATIDGAASATINTNYGVLRLYSDGANWFTF